MDNAKQKHRYDVKLEIYKSIVALASFALKLMLVLNGGAAVALVSFMSNASKQGAASATSLSPLFKVSVVTYVTGLAFAAVSLAVGYWSQIVLLQQWDGDPSFRKVPFGTRSLFAIAVLFGILSFLAFFLGSIEAIGEETLAKVLYCKFLRCL